MIIEYRIFIFIVDKSLKLTAFMIVADDSAVSVPSVAV